MEQQLKLIKHKKKHILSNKFELMKLHQKYVKNKLSSIASIEFHAAQHNDIMIEQRREHLYRGMSKEEYHQYYDEAYNLLSQ